MPAKFPHLEHIVATAVTDSSFRTRLLNGDRSQVIAAFDLAQDEREVILAIRADTLEAFAQELLYWMRQHDAARLGTPTRDRFGSRV
jgi:hypothetical protein